MRFLRKYFKTLITKYNLKKQWLINPRLSRKELEKYCSSLFDDGLIFDSTQGYNLNIFLFLVNIFYLLKAIYAYSIEDIEILLLIGDISFGNGPLRTIFNSTLIFYILFLLFLFLTFFKYRKEGFRPLFIELLIKVMTEITPEKFGVKKSAKINKRSIYILYFLFSFTDILTNFLFLIVIFGTLSLGITFMSSDLLLYFSFYTTIIFCLIGKTVLKPLMHMFIFFYFCSRYFLIKLDSLRTRIIELKKNPNKTIHSIIEEYKNLEKECENNCGTHISMFIFDVLFIFNVVVAILFTFLFTMPNPFWIILFLILFFSIHY